MGEVIVQKLNELQKLDQDIHWFCPRSSAEDAGLYYDEDILDILPQEPDTAKDRRSQDIRDADRRRDSALQAAKIFAFDGSDAKPYQDLFRKSLVAQLTRCDICVRQYHRSRSLLVQDLEAEFDAEDVQQFMTKFDSMNIARIGEGLSKMAATLRPLPPEERKIQAVDNQCMYALLEALNCIPFLLSEEALRQTFDYAFDLVQSKRKLKLPTYTPGLICFLFSHSQKRSAWAFRNITTIKRPLADLEFEHSVKPFLEAAMSRVHILSLEKEYLPTFWNGVKLIIPKLTKELVTNRLRAMDSNLYTLALEHFQIDERHFNDLLGSYQSLMKLSPQDFWDAMGTITAPAVAETIFRSPVLHSFLTTTEEREPLHLDEKMEWTIDLVNSVKPENLVPPVRTILNQLLKHFQTAPYSRYAQNVTFSTGLSCLLTALNIMKEKVRFGPLVTNMIQVVAQDHIESIVQELSSTEKKNTELQIGTTEQLCLDIVQQVIMLDIAGLAHDRSTVVKSATLDHELGVSGLEIWKRSMRQIRPDFPALAVSILSGITGLLPLENFTSRQIEKALKPARGWNDALKRVLNYVCDDLLGRLDTFEHDPLLEVLQEPKAMDGFASLLFNGEARVNHAAVNVLKTLSGAQDRRGSVLHIIRALSRTSMNAINKALHELSRSSAFAPCAMALKVCTDVFSCLCDSHDGVLRSQNELQAQPNILELYWKLTWQLLGVIFQQTEPWSNLGYDKEMLQEFCRETMDFADYTFEQYAIIASTLEQGHQQKREDIQKMLLEHAKKKFLPIARWLRLRDEYLISKALSLTVKILGRLQEVDIKIDEDAAQFIQDVIMSTEKGGKAKTKLNMQQKAELQRALERHMDISLSEVIDVDAEPRSLKQMSLQQWASSGRSSRASTPLSDTARSSKPGTIDVDAWSDAAKRKKELHAYEDEEMKKLMGTMKGSETLRQRLQQQQQQKKPGVSSATAKAAQQRREDPNFVQKRQQAKEELERQKKAQLAKMGGGTGVVGLGDIGKDHSLKGQNVMVSSDEESDEDDEADVDDDLFGPSNKKKKIARPNVDPNGAVGLKPEQKLGPTKIQRTARSAKDMRARLAPDLTPLHRVILRWDFFHTGDYPPGANEYQFRQVPNSFSDPVTYQETFQPLLTLEAWQGMVKAREEENSKAFEVKVQNRTNVDAFIEISSSVSQVENREIQLREGDIILLSKAKKPTEDSTAPHCLARIYRIKRQKAQLEVVYQLLPGTSLAPSLTGSTSAWGQKVQSITPLEREYGALQALQYYDLCNQIIKARPSKRMNFSEKQIAAYQDVWNVNRAQSEAINAALENEGFSLIQGPPGSGKTKTIVAIVGGLLTQSLSASSSGSRISMPKAHGNQSNGSDAPPRKLLVCAPSNAAVDELVMRLKDGVKTKSGKQHQLNVVRIGRSEAINSQVLDVTMDELVAKRLGNRENDQRLRERNAELFKEHSKVSAIYKELFAKKDSGQVKGKELSELEADIAVTRRKKNELGVRIDNAKDAERNAGREVELNKKRAQQAILDDAHVICATLSGSGHDMFQSLDIEFETVIIDEAAQCVEMSSLIPLKYGCVKCIMVGDPKQLPPTVFSKEAAKFQYEQSLFVRMQNNFANEVHLLDTQYRMHPEISVFPSQTFYDGLLKDGKGMAALRQQPWHASALLAPYRFFDVAGQHQSAPKGHSLVNLAEVDIAIALFDRLTSDFSNYDYNGRVGVITPYKSQLRVLKERFASRFGNDIFDTVEFNTTDAFQGRESEIIIFSCVRASPAGGIGFLQDIRRMNVGLTRAKSSLWVLGNSESLVRGQFWKKLVEDARARDRYTTGNLRAMLNKPSSAYPVQDGRTMLDVSTHVTQLNGNGSPQPEETDMSRRPSAPSNGTLGNTIRPTGSTTVSDADRMEGISYRFADRVSKKKAPAPDISSNRSTPQTSSRNLSESAEQQDVEMESSDGTADRVATPNSTGSRAETPLSGEEKPLNPDNGTVKLRTGHMAPSVPHQARKRPPANPFMPSRKQPRPRP
ncbi:DEAD-box type RNA helicase [Vermiconidia calcicola]|uniref:DEAD-box type RNA helicase n=1 Tax=Vermiconidia calcicola TaxID=1690605 RepID=A0ACC3MHX6_9PEZI|nr:DEAD-box type RNA helicase [Vermiconidia calcicola]